MMMKTMMIGIAVGIGVIGAVGGVGVVGSVMKTTR
jgi:hypothetical protein